MSGKPPRDFWRVQEIVFHVVRAVDTGVPDKGFPGLGHAAFFENFVEAGGDLAVVDCLFLEDCLVAGFQFNFVLEGSASRILSSIAGSSTHFPIRRVLWCRVRLIVRSISMRREEGGGVLRLYFGRGGLLACGRASRTRL
jgi:hypothetical protein